MTMFSYNAELEKMASKDKTGEDFALHIIDWALENPLLVSNLNSLSIQRSTKNQTAQMYCADFSKAAAFATGVAEAQRLKKTMRPVVALVGDTATYDSSPTEISGAAQRNTPMIYICMNNETSVTSGNHYSSSTPRFTENRRNQAETEQQQKNLISLISKHGVYCATASIGFPMDFADKLKHINKSRKFGFINLLIPDSKAWGFNKEGTIEISRLAVETGYWPLYEVDERGQVRLTHKEHYLKDQDEFTMPQARFAGMSQRQRLLMQDAVNIKYHELLKNEAMGK